MNEEWCVGYEEGKMDALKEIESAIEAAVLAEREACAKVCEEMSNPFGYANLTAEDCAATIRARGE